MHGQVERSGRRAEIVGAAGAIILGAVLIIATFGKVIAPIVFVEQIRNEGLDIIFSANTVALLALAIEMWLGVALLLGDRSRWILYPTAFLVGFFLIMTGRTYWLVLTGQLDNSHDCGCFGVFLQRTATEAFWQDLFILGVPLLMCFQGRRVSVGRGPSWRFWAGALGAAMIVVYAVFAIGMPQAVPVGSVSAPIAGNFQLTEDYRLVIDNEDDPRAQIFQSDVDLQFVVLSSQLTSPLVLDLRNNTVLAVSPEMVRQAGGDRLDLPSTSGAEDLGSFEVGPEGLSFAWRGREIRVKSR